MTQYSEIAYAFAGPLCPCNVLTDRSAVDGFGLPRFADKNLDGTVFLYPSAQAAAARQRLGGSGFLVGRPIPGGAEIHGTNVYVTYLVSNGHVVLEGSACVATVNRKDGGAPDIWDIDQNDWVAHPNGDDVAVTPALPYLNRAIHKASFIPEARMLTKQHIADLDIGVGDDVFMVGRFVNLQGHAVNQPALRFGNISVMNTMIPTMGPGGVSRAQESYAVEMRSRTGFSGSPVCVYRSDNALIELPENARSTWGLLGVNWGYIKDEDGENSWLNGVVPAWKILEVLNTPALRQFQKTCEDDFRANNGFAEQAGLVKEA